MGHLQRVRSDEARRNFPMVQLPDGAHAWRATVRCLQITIDLVPWAEARLSHSAYFALLRVFAQCVGQARPGVASKSEGLEEPRLAGPVAVGRVEQVSN